MNRKDQGERIEEHLENEGGNSFVYAAHRPERRLSKNCRLQALLNRDDSVSAARRTASGGHDNGHCAGHTSGESDIDLV